MSDIEADVPDGYKMTELGVLPDDWDVQRFGYGCRSFETTPRVIQKHQAAAA